MNEPLPAVCPKCSSPRLAGALECPRCGVIYGRFQQRPRPQAAIPQVAPVPPAETRVERPGGYVSPRQLETALTLLAQALESGLPLTTFVYGPGAACLPPAQQRRLQADVQAGVPLSESFGGLGVLDPGSLALIRAGERHGRLPESLRQIARRLEERRKDRNKLVLALLYPSALFVAGALLLPLPTLFTRGLAAYAAKALPLLLGLGGLGFCALFVLPRLPADSAVRRLLRELGATLPLVSAVVWSNAVATFADVLGASLRAGLPSREALDLASRATGHRRFESAHQQLIASLDAGATLTQALGAVRGLDRMFVSQLGAGEQSGTLDTLLPRIADDYRRQARVAAIVLVGAVGALAFLGVLAVMALEVVQGWQGIMDSRANSIDQLVGH